MCVLCVCRVCLCACTRACVCAAAPNPTCLLSPFLSTQVELLPLPENTPETLPIVCAGRYGELQLRTQRVLYEGVAMTASRFEQLCGRGDAKKWKNSFWWADNVLVTSDVTCLDWHCAGAYCWSQEVEEWR